MIRPALYQLCASHDGRESPAYRRDTINTNGEHIPTQWPSPPSTPSVRNPSRSRCGYLSAFPDQVKARVGGALWDAQRGLKANSAKPLRGFTGAGVLEVVADFDGDTFRTVYTVRFEQAIFVLHAFQKKSKPGVATPKTELDLIRERLARARTLASTIREVIRRQKLTQVEAARAMQIDQPKVSALVNGRLESFSSEWLMRLLTRLGQDVEIIVKAAPKTGFENPETLNLER